MKVKVLGKSIEVVEKKFDVEGRMGQFDSEPTLRIQLCPTLNSEQRVRVLRHEMFHALLHLTGFAALMTYNENESLTLVFERHAEDILNESNKIINKK